MPRMFHDKTDYVLLRLQLSIDKGDWNESLALAKQTAERFPTGDEQKKIAEAMVPLLEQGLAPGFGANRFQLVQLADFARGTLGKLAIRV